MGLDNKRGQITIFIVIAIILVVGIATFFIYKTHSEKAHLKSTNIVYDSYMVCIEKLARESISIIGSSGGYITLPNYEFGSEYMPSSSQLNFIGSSVPYWFYVSGNNVAREQIPSKRSMESEIETYIGNNIQKCDMSELEKQGYVIDIDKGTVHVEIKENQININLENELRVLYQNQFSIFNKHNLNLDSRLGKLYDLAKKIYDYESENLFLESYALDILQTYAPTTGVDMGCSPIFFNFQEIKKNLSEALSNNFAYVKLKGTYSTANYDYYVQDIGISVKENINFMYSTDWPTKIEIHGDDFVQPVGLSEGMAVLGFCYVPYHLVYDISFPLMIQIYDNQETFQFPVVVVIRKNQPRDAVYSGDFIGEDLKICENRNSEIKVTTSDLYLNPVEADISISCLNSGCTLGRTSTSQGKSELNTLAPSCVNALISASAEGYSVGTTYLSTNEDSYTYIILKKKYSIPLDLGNIGGTAIVRFEGDDYSTVVSYPEQSRVDLVEGFYNISVHVFGDSLLTIPAHTEKRCFNSPSGGLKGLLGLEENKCFETTIPEQKIEGVLIGGGNAIDYFVESDLNSASKLNINTPLFGPPVKITDLTENYIKLEDSLLEVNFIR